MAGELNLYDVEIHGTKTQMKLTAEDAKRMGGTSVTSTPKIAGRRGDGADDGEGRGVARGDEDPDAPDVEEPSEAPEGGQKNAPARSKARTARNKARDASNKDASNKNE